MCHNLALTGLEGRALALTVLYAPIWPRVPYMCLDLALTILHVLKSGLDCLICAHLTLGVLYVPESDLDFLVSAEIWSRLSDMCCNMVLTGLEGRVLALTVLYVPIWPWVSYTCHNLAVTISHVLKFSLNLYVLKSGLDCFRRQGAGLDCLACAKLALGVLYVP